VALAPTELARGPALGSRQEQAVSDSQVISPRELTPERLRRRCDPAQFPFECTEDLSPTEGFIGQERAIRAIEFGLAVDRPGYNIFVSGLTGTGRVSVVRSYLQSVVQKKGAAALGLPAASDWCYVYNVTDPDRPLALHLPAGGGRGLRAHMEEFVRGLRSELVRTLGSDEYRTQRKAVTDAGQGRQRRIFAELEQQAALAGFALQMSRTGVSLIPMANGRQMTQEEYGALPPDQRTEIDSRRVPLWDQVQAAFEQVRIIDREAGEALRALERRAAEFAISKPFNNLLADMREPDVARYLEDMRGYTLANLALFAPSEGEQEAPAPAPNGGPPGPGSGRDPFIAYRVNVFVDNSDATEPPVVVESNPTWGNLFGRIERRAVLGAYFSDHTMLKAGSIARANGGYLVVNARELLVNPGVWETLKRAIRNREARLEDPAEAFGMMAPQGLRPQAVPLDLKVIVTGDPDLYGMLSRLDEDFWEVFKVRADFDHQVADREDYRHAYADFICITARQERLRHFTRDGVARVIEHGARMVADQGKLTARFGFLKDILIEADHWAGVEGCDLVSERHVSKALDERIYRSSLVAERIDGLIADGTIMVDVAGAVVGQVNGLAVYDLGDVAFGKPSRITARTFMGRSGVINIERESKLSGSTHDKGVLILSGYLGATYAQDKPLGVSASVCFEQSYGGVDGDSASSTELYAIISSLADAPVRQGIAVTGSVNQKGEVQAIGGVNEKVEGFFDVCRAVGLTGDQGVMIPAANARNLMLREDVVAAAAGGQFHVWAVSSIDEGLEILTGVPAGQPGPDGYPADSVHGRADRRLREFAAGLRRFGVSDGQPPPSLG
jgi:predicted ATP-dependent protease